MLSKWEDRTTQIGSMIDGYLKSSVELSDESIHLLYSANRWESKAKIEEYLSNGVSIICDRYAYSGVAFSMAKGMDRVWCQQPDQGLPRPDLLLFLTLSPEAAAERPGFGEERYEESEFQKKVRVAYARLEKEEEHSIPWTYINAERTEDEVLNDMKTEVLKIIDDCKNKPVLPLWRKQ